jgi:hypothetical protein
MMVRNGWMAIAAAVGLVGLALDFWVIAGTMGPPQNRSLPDFLIYYFTFLTNLSNTALLLIYLSEATGWRWLGWFRHPVTRAGMAGIMVLVMGFYHFMLAPTLEDLPRAIEISNVLLHYCTPLLFLGWWALFTRHGGLRIRDIATMLAPGLGYVGWVLLRGLVAGEYPYTILDPTFAISGRAAQGYAGVAIGVGVLVALVAIYDLLLVGVDALIARARGRG